jgi:hypothetical protein
MCDLCVMPRCAATFFDDWLTTSDESGNRTAGAKDRKPRRRSNVTKTKFRKERKGGFSAADKQDAGHLRVGHLQRFCSDNGV